MSPARRAAWNVLRKVSQGAHATDALIKETAGLDARDAALAHQIVYGCLRYQGQLDHLIEVFSGRPQPKMDPDLRRALHMGIFQLRYLDRIPPHAAVSESVELVKRTRKPAAASFVNAVLRRVNRRKIEFPDAAAELSMPHWLLDRWMEEFGPEEASRMARAAMQEPDTYIRIPPGESPEEGQMAEPTDVPGCFLLREGSPGRFRVQDIGAQSIVPLLELRPGQRFLDLCAAPGNKTAQALETAVWAVAADRQFGRIQDLVGLEAPKVVLDAGKGLPFGAVFDRVLVDAPCSGTGTLGRNPEIKWRLREEDLARHHERQVKILVNAMDAVKPGGRLVYSTCSLEREENEDVVQTALERRPGFRLLETGHRLPGVHPGDGFFAAVLTSGVSESDA
ncbi:MAG: hypothetical protein K2X35_01565 [Bryobacteraceae bacterium]|nr:hypothetical protein [Bryobacteraceae bacterium]